MAERMPNTCELYLVIFGLSFVTMFALDTQTIILLFPWLGVNLAITAGILKRKQWVPRVYLAGNIATIIFGAIASIIAFGIPPEAYWLIAAVTAKDFVFLTVFAIYFYRNKKWFNR